MSARLRGNRPPAGRTAIVHDWFQGYHGSERTVDVIRGDVFAPEHEPDVFTFFAARELLPPQLARAIVSESRLARIPGLRQVGHGRGRWRLLLPYMPHYFRRLDLAAYDLLVTSSHAFAGHARGRRGALHVSYCYTPLRYAWLPETDRRSRALSPARTYLRRVDREAAQRPDALVAISGAVQERIRRFYGRDATVIHPPVEVDDLRADAAKEPGSFLWVHRLVPYKSPLLVAEAFRGLPYRLTMVGVGPLERELRKRLPANVTLLGWVPRPELARLYASASGFLHVAEEDFGISTVEALASGTPVVALRAGGALDVVRDGVDGVLLDRATIGAIRDAVAEVAGGEWDAARLREQAERFSRSRFVERMRALLLDLGVSPARLARG